MTKQISRLKIIVMRAVDTHILNSFIKGIYIFNPPMVVHGFGDGVGLAVSYKASRFFQRTNLIQEDWRDTEMGVHTNS